MRKRRLALLPAVALLLASILPALANNTFLKAPKGDTSCHPQAIRDLELFSPRGAQVFQALTDRTMFWPFLTCDNVALGLSTAVHEGVHGLTEQLDGYPLLHGGVLKRPHEVERFFPPRLISARFSRDNIYVQNYLLPGAASSADTLMFLFDELNAYTHDLHTSVRIRSLPGGQIQVDHRDGLSSLMRFLMHYADEARASQPETWRGLKSERVRNVVRTLWGQAETTLAASCGIPRFGNDDHRYVAEMCDPRKSAALSEVLGRGVVCHRRCLRQPDEGSEPRFEVADASGGQTTTTEATGTQEPPPPPPAATPARVSRPARRPTRWPVVVTRTQPVTLAAATPAEPVTLAAATLATATPVQLTLARFASPVRLSSPQLVAAPMLVRHIE